MDTQERLRSPAWPARILNAGSSDQSHPGHHQPYAPRRQACFDAPENGPLTERGFVLVARGLPAGGRDHTSRCMNRVRNYSCVMKDDKASHPRGRRRSMPSSVRAAIADGRCRAKPVANLPAPDPVPSELVRALFAPSEQPAKASSASPQRRSPIPSRNTTACCSTAPRRLWRSLSSTRQESCRAGLLYGAGRPYQRSTAVVITFRGQIRLEVRRRADDPEAVDLGVKCDADGL